MLRPDEDVEVESAGMHGFDFEATAKEFIVVCIEREPLIAENRAVLARGEADRVRRLPARKICLVHRHAGESFAQRLDAIDRDRSAASGSQQRLVRNRLREDQARREPDKVAETAEEPIDQVECRRRTAQLINKR